MKRLGITIFILLIGYAVFYDIKIGTLPMLQSYKEKMTAPATTSTVNEKTSIQYENIEVKNGDTVLSIVEEINKKKYPSIEKIVGDFKELNPNESLGKLKVGKTYKFPLYK